MAEARQICTFAVDRHLMGLEVGLVQEVLRQQPVTPVPLAPPAIRGLINLRGSIVPAVDLRICLGLEQPIGATGDRGGALVVLRTDDGPTCLAVDAIRDVVAVPEADREPIPGTVPASVRDLLRGAYPLEGQLLLEIDAARLVQRLGEG